MSIEVDFEAVNAEFTKRQGDKAKILEMQAALQNQLIETEGGTTPLPPLPSLPFRYACRCVLALICSQPWRTFSLSSTSY